MRERKVEAYLTTEVKRCGGWAIKLLTPLVRGLPDRLVLMPGGRVYFVELKAPGKKPGKMQELIHKRLRALGFQVWVIDSFHGVDLLINEAIF